jgi:hypothetical protein
MLKFRPVLFTVKEFCLGLGGTTVVSARSNFFTADTTVVPKAGFLHCGHDVVVPAVDGRANNGRVLFIRPSWLHAVKEFCVAGTTVVRIITSLNECVHFQRNFSLSLIDDTTHGQWL